MADQIPPFALVRIQALRSAPFHIGETVSWPIPEDGTTLVRIIPGHPCSARLLDTKRISVVDVEIFRDHCDAWAAGSGEGF